MRVSVCMPSSGVLDRQVHERLQASARIGLDPPVPVLETIRRVAHDEPPKAFIGRNDVASVAQQAERNARLSGGKKGLAEGSRISGPGEQVCGPSDGEPRARLQLDPGPRQSGPLIRERRSAKARADCIASSNIQL